MKKSVLIVPARLNSSRLSQKMLLDLGGMPVIERTLRQAKKTTAFARILLATDTEEIAAAARRCDVQVVMTSKECSSGSDRAAEAVLNHQCDTVMVLQGDEPFIDPRLLDALITKLNTGNEEMASAMWRVKNWDDALDPSVVKVVCDKNGHAMYFSRNLIPYCGHPNKSGPIPPDTMIMGHIGVYAYRRDALLSYPSLPESKLEKSERLEQLRAMEHGWKIKMMPWEKSGIGINTKEDLLKARLWLKEHISAHP